jgi:hypothetical protein
LAHDVHFLHLCPCGCKSQFIFGWQENLDRHFQAGGLIMPAQQLCAWGQVQAVPIAQGSSVDFGIAASSNTLFERQREKINYSNRFIMVCIQQSFFLIQGPIICW